jgi:hypothetical protein
MGDILLIPTCIPIGQKFLQVEIVKIKNHFEPTHNAYIFAIRLVDGQRKRGISSVGRALAWHARGHRFESGILHKINLTFCAIFFGQLHLVVYFKIQ